MDIPLPDRTAAAHGSHFHKYMEVAMVLSLLTGVEIVIIYLPFSFWLIFWCLAVLSLAKFLYVIFYFMHLAWEKALCTVVFIVGLLVASLTGWALHALFAEEASLPLTAASRAESGR